MSVLYEAGAWHTFSKYEHGLYRGILRFSYQLCNSLLEKKGVELVFFSSYKNTSDSFSKRFRGFIKEKRIHDFTLVFVGAVY